MKKNVASQAIGAQMVSANDGSAFTSAVTVSVTGDAGTQATGSVGAGACAHEGNGFHTYAPAQAETNYDHVAFTFTGTGAIPSTVQVYTTFPQTGDNFARLGAPAGASVSADIAARASQASVDDVPTNAELATALGTADDAVLVQVALVKAKTDLIPADPADASDINDSLATLAGYIDTEVAAIKAKTDLIPASPAAVGDLTQVAADAAFLRELADDTVIVGTVGSGSTTTSLVSSALSPAGVVADQFKGRIVVFDADTTTTALRGQATDITANTSASTPTFTVTALTTAPASGDTFHIV